jgi:serine O-acetyltransferase
MAGPTANHLALVCQNGKAESQNPQDRLWLALRQEAKDAYAGKPALGPLFLETILNRHSFEAALAYRLALRLQNELIPLALLTETFQTALAEAPGMAVAARADLDAVMDRDPACQRYIEPFLYFKGFHALQTHRLAHWLWQAGDRDFAMYLQSRSSELFQTDIHPAAQIGQGIMLDHATGLVVGETSVIEDGVSLLQDVTLGGTGKQIGDRHPKIRAGAMIGAGAKILGNIEVGAHSRVAAGSVVLREVPPYATVTGVPAKVIRIEKSAECADCLDQVLSNLSYDGFNYSI